ncbi:TBC1 domain family member 15-like, partial [Clarias magur]
MCPTLAFVSGHICVEQQPSIVHLTEGENVTLSCNIRGNGGEKISKFHVEWYRQGAGGKLHEIVNLSQLRGRFHENTNRNQQSASLSITMLELNDTGRYFCNFIYQIDQKILQHYANGTSIIVQEEVTTVMTILSTTDNVGNTTGGVSPEERGMVWRFLFGMYPCSSTILERTLLLEQMSIRYHVMKRKWQRLLPGAVSLRLNGTDAELAAAVQYFEQRQERERETLQHQYKSKEVKDKISFLELQAQVLFERVTFDLEELQEAIRIIDKDVPRTDRGLAYYTY